MQNDQWYIAYDWGGLPTNIDFLFLDLKRMLTNAPSKSFKIYKNQHLIVVINNFHQLESLKKLLIYI